MKSLKLILVSLAAFFIVIYVLIVAFLYFNQEDMIFPGERLSRDYKFAWPSDYEEINIPVEDNVNLNGLLFKAKESKGLIFYLHGNGGNLKTWGGIAQTYTDLGYDIFILDYRGYGKSGGNIESEEEFLGDIRKAYAELLKRYDESNIIVIGYSIGTGAATILASENNPEKLILKAPYYSLTEVIDGRMPFMPEFLQKYKFETYKFLEKVKCPVYIFHGTGDRVIPYQNSVKLKKHVYNAELITLQGTQHLIDGNNPEYIEKLKTILY